MSPKPFMRPLFAAIIVALLQTAFIGYMIESRASILRNGVDVVLKTAPVDPRDLLRGDYVILTYDISTIPADKVTGGFPTEATDAQLSVRLEKQPDGFWGVTEASFGALAAKAESVLIRSAPFYYYPTPDTTSPPSLNVEYGIERYYAQRCLEVRRHAVGRENDTVDIQPFIVAEDFRKLRFDTDRTAEAETVDLDNDGLAARCVPAIQLAVRQEPLIVTREQMSRVGEHMQTVMRRIPVRHAVRPTNHCHDVQAVAKSGDRAKLPLLHRPVEPVPIRRTVHLEFRISRKRGLAEAD